MRTERALSNCSFARCRKLRSRDANRTPMHQFGIFRRSGSTGRNFPSRGSNPFAREQFSCCDSITEFNKSRGRTRRRRRRWSIWPVSSDQPKRTSGSCCSLARYADLFRPADAPRPSRSAPWHTSVRSSTNSVPTLSRKSYLDYLRLKLRQGRRGSPGHIQKSTFRDDR